MLLSLPVHVCAVCVPFYFCWATRDRHNSDFTILGYGSLTKDHRGQVTPSLVRSSALTTGPLESLAVIRHSLPYSYKHGGWCDSIEDSDRSPCGRQSELGEREGESDGDDIDKLADERERAGFDEDSHNGTKVVGPASSVTKEGGIRAFLEVKS